MAIKIEDLKSLIAKHELVIASVEEDTIMSPNSDETQKGYTLTLVKPLAEVKSTTLTDGKKVVAKNAVTVQVVGEEDIKSLLEDSEKNDDGTIVYNGSMKLDVARPKTRLNQATGKYEVVLGPRVFLTNIVFSKRATKLRNERLAGAATALAAFLEGAVAAAPVENAPAGSVNLVDVEE